MVLFPPSGDHKAWARSAGTGARALWAKKLGAGRSDISTQGALSKDGSTNHCLVEFNGGNGVVGLYALDVGSYWTCFVLQGA